ncbi:MAG: phosphotransferase [Chloroflexi bacterium]|nr:phosphotransferase [Chloroflexota bacterium]
MPAPSAQLPVPSQLLERIQACRPDLTIHSARSVDEGLENHVVIVNEALVFRFPRRPGGQALAHESRVLKLLTPRRSLAVPAFEPCGDGVAYPLLPGEPLNQGRLLSLDPAAQEYIAWQIGTFLRQMHAVDADAARQAGVEPAGSVRSQRDWEELYQQAQLELFPLLGRDGQDWIHSLFAPLSGGWLDMEAYEPVLVHGDLAPYHFLCDYPAGRLSGVLDFGTAGLGDPADDYANVIAGLGERFLRRVARYDPGVEPALERARFRAGALEVWWALNGLRSGDPSWFLVHLGRARDAGPYGLRWEDPPAW